MRIQILLFLFFLVCLNGISFSQPDKEINQTDKKGQKQGFWIKYYPDGKVMYEGYFKDNKPEGELKRYFETGELKSVMNFVPDSDSAFAKIYYDNGKLAAEGLFIDQKKEGVWKYYSYYDETLRDEETYDSGVRHGIARKYYQDGTLSEEITWVNNLEHGDWKMYYESGKIKLHANYKMGKLDGPFKVYLTNGQIEILGYYSEGLQDGIWQYFDENAQLKTSIEYDNGTPKDQEKLDQQQEEFFKMIEENAGKYQEPSVEDVLR